MKPLVLASLALATAAAATTTACTDGPTTGTETSALAAVNTDFAPVCAGILSYINWASYSELGRYLPNSLAQAINNGGTNPGLYDMLGRRFTIGVRFRH